LEKESAVFPRIGWRAARHTKSHGKFSKPWKNPLVFFQASEIAGQKFVRKALALH
jgi:hypothetical protein